MEEYSIISNLKVSKKLENFIQQELLKDLKIKPKVFWKKFDSAVHELAKINSKLIRKREELQKKIDECLKKKSFRLVLRYWRNIWNNGNYHKSQNEANRL